MVKLNFGRGNAKLDKLAKLTGKQVWTFSLLSGHTCPYAKDCLSSAVEQSDGSLKIVDGPHTVFRCFSASQEALFKNVYKSRKQNTDTILPIAAKSVEAAAQVILDNIPKKAGIIRIHVGGDFKTKNYMAAWLLAASQRPDVIFYTYTKSLPFMVALRESIPSNFIFTASYGGWKDSLIAKENLRNVKVIFSETEAELLGLPIDSDDMFAYNPDNREQSFALLIHGAQPKGSDAGKAVRKLNGKGSYSKTK